MATNSPPSNLPIVNDSPTPKPVSPLSVASAPTLAPAPAPKIPLSSPPLVLVKPALPAPLSPPTLPTAPTQSTKSFIRTMDSDVKSAKQGSTPKPIEVVVPGSISALPVAPQLPKPATGELKPQTLVPQISLGGAEKRGNLPSLPSVKSVVPVTKPPVSGIQVPAKPGVFSKKNLLIIGVVVLLVAAGGYWYFVLKQAQPPSIITETASPAPSLTPTPSSVSSLAYAFPVNYSVALPTASASFSFLESQALSVNSGDSSKNILLNTKDSSGVGYKFSSFFNLFSPGYPPELVLTLDNTDFNLIISKQSEKFSQKGQLIQNQAITGSDYRFGVAVRVLNTDQAKVILNSWESTLIQNLKTLFTLSGDTFSVKFQDNSHGGVAIRYANFPYPDKSIDYAIVRANNNNDYLVITNSREQMYSIIDSLLGF